MKKIYLLSSIGMILIGLTLIFAFKNESSSMADKGYAIGDVVADFKLKSTSGGMTSMTQNRSAKGYIIVFTCNHCPFSKAYESRVMALDKKYASQGYPVLAINPNDPNAYEEDTFENMQAVAKSKGYTFEYLQDETQNIARAFGAARTPSTYVVKREGDKFYMQYIGGIDDNSQDANGVTKRYIEDAVNNLLAGKPVVVNMTKSVGCAIKWKGV
ncbi:MAG: thioredoxin family protein [Arcicella sp.]|nr:thioredoxin family protein [Arcicella sp.]